MESSPPSSPRFLPSSVTPPPRKNAKKLGAKLGLLTNFRKMLRASSSSLPQSPSSPQLSDASETSVATYSSRDRDGESSPDSDCTPRPLPTYRPDSNSRSLSTPSLNTSSVSSALLAGPGSAVNPKRSSMSSVATAHQASAASAFNPHATSVSALNRHVSLPSSAALLERYGPTCAVLGSGSCSDTFVVTRPWDKKCFAIKEFKPRPKGQSEAEYIKKLTSEFCIGTMLHHPNVVETVDLIIDPEQHAFEVMELCENGDLFDAIASTEMTPAEADCCFAQLLRGVAYMHKVGVCHRDLKPENLLFDSTNHLKIIDFGSAEIILPTPTASDVGLGVVVSEDENGATSACVSPVLPKAALPFAAPDVSSVPAALSSSSNSRRNRANRESLITKRVMEVVRVFNDTMRDPHALEADGLASEADGSSRLDSSSSSGSQEPSHEVHDSNGVKLTPIAKKSRGICGTGPYMAPEEFLGVPYDGRKVDIWACGVIYLVMMYCRFPWEKAILTDPNYSSYVHHSSGHPWTRFFDNLPDGPRSLIPRMLHPDPEKRPLVTEVLEDEWFKGIFCCCDAAPKADDGSPDVTTGNMEPNPRAASSSASHPSASSSQSTVCHRHGKIKSLLRSSMQRALNDTER